MNIVRIVIYIMYSLIACFYKVFIPHQPQRSIDKIDLLFKNSSILTTTTTTFIYRKPTTMPQIRVDWLEKFGLIKRTSSSAPPTYL